MNRHLPTISRFPLEALVWISGLVLLLLIPSSGESHFTVCPLSLSGIEWCPGCGLGRSIAFLFQGSFKESFEMHPLGFIAVIILISRIIVLLKTHFRNYGKGY